MGPGRSARRRTAVLADSHPLWLDALERLVTRAGVEVVATAPCSTDALAALAELQPNVLVTALDMPAGELSGLTLIGYGRECVPGMKVLVVSSHEDAAAIDGAFAAGADAYVAKTAQPEELVAAVRRAAAHPIHLAAADAARPERPKGVEEAGLTRRELEFLRLLAEGRSDAELARMLWTTEEAVELRVAEICGKLEVPDRDEAGRWAEAQGVFTSPAGRAA
jgi:DNA-binding NarL/FixJ family response regulator